MLKSQFATDDFIDRIKRSYKLAIDTADPDKGDIWSAIDGLRIPVHYALINDGRDAVRNMLIDPGTTDIFYGMDNLALSLKKDGVEFVKEQEAHSAMMEHVIRVLGQSFGVARWVPPQMQEYYLQNNPVPAPPLETDEILDKINEVAGFTVDFPNPFEGEIGRQTKYGLCSIRAAWAVYQAFRLHQEANPKQNASALEIGPGMGRTVYYAYRAGMKCTTLDLPMGVVAQACFLGATIGPDHIFFLGDEGDSKGKIRLFPSSHLSSLVDQFDVVLNVDSLVEMGNVEIDAYLKWINSHAKTFVSINHEACKSTMADAIRRNMDAFYYSRFPYRFMESHTEEIVKLSNQSTDGIHSRSPAKSGSILSKLASYALFRGKSQTRA